MKLLRTFLVLLAIAGAATSCTRQRCRRGHLTGENSCERQQGLFYSIGVGWDSHLAKGKVEKSFCESIRNTGEKGSFQGFGSVNAQFKKVPCDSYLPSYRGTCLFGQKDDDVAIVAVDESCDNGIFFNGHGRTLLNGQIVSFKIK